MIFLQFFILICFIVPNESQDTLTTINGTQRLRPSVTIIFGLLVVGFLFFVTLSIFIYSKYFYRHLPNLLSPHNNFEQLVRSDSNSSGIDRNVIESIPFFKFSSLKGSKRGLECSICLSKFEDSEVLRLLPNCKHAFHMNCIDEWLLRHSSCPLCRHKFNATEFVNFICTNSLRYNGNSSPLNQIDSPNLELFVEREEDRHGTTRFNFGNKFKEPNDDNCVPLEGDIGKKFHNYKHKIIVSDIFHKRRWSDLKSSDLILLNSEMLNVMSSKRFDLNSPNISLNEQILKIKEDMERKAILESKIGEINQTMSVSGSSALSPPISNEESKINIETRLLSSTDKKSMSEITILKRFKYIQEQSNKISESSSLGNNLREERIRRLWLPIARRTLQRFAVRERNFEGFEMRIHTSNV